MFQNKKLKQENEKLKKDNNEYRKIMTITRDLDLYKQQFIQKVMK